MYTFAPTLSGVAGSVRGGGGVEGIGGIRLKINKVQSERRRVEDRAGGTGSESTLLSLSLIRVPTPPTATGHTLGSRKRVTRPPQVWRRKGMQRGKHGERHAHWTSPRALHLSLASQLPCAARPRPVRVSVPSDVFSLHFDIFNLPFITFDGFSSALLPSSSLPPH